MSTEPALMSLVEVARAIAEKRLSSHEVTQACLNRIAQWQPRLNAFMAIEAEAALKAADEADAALGRGENRWRVARRAACAQGYVLRGRQGRHLRLVYPARLCRHHHLDRVAAPEECRIDPVGIAADGGIRLRTDRPQFPLWRGPQSLALRPRHRRLVVRLGRGGRGAAELCRAGLRHRRLDSDARAFLRCHRAEDDLRSHQPRRRDAAVAVARYGWDRLRAPRRIARCCSV